MCAGADRLIQDQGDSKRAYRRAAATSKLVPQLAGSAGSGPVTPVPVGVVLGGGTVGSAYSETISAQGGSGSAYVYALLSGSFPTGTNLNPSTGVISGTTSTAGTFTFTIKVTDSGGNVGTREFLDHCECGHGGRGCVDVSELGLHGAKQS